MICFLNVYSQPKKSSIRMSQSCWLRFEGGKKDTSLLPPASMPFISPCHMVSIHRKWDLPIEWLEREGVRFLKEFWGALGEKSIIWLWLSIEGIWHFHLQLSSSNIEQIPVLTRVLRRKRRERKQSGCDDSQEDIINI